MKTKSKRLLAVFLSAVMVLSTFAAMPFSSYAAEHTAADLKDLIDQYESRVESGTVYTNLADSYTAWYDAYVTYIFVTAGTKSADEVDSAYSSLQTEMNEMQVWSPYQATASAAADGSYNKDILVAGDVMSNVLYAYGVGGNAPYNDSEASDGFATYTRAGVQYGDTVLMYDGISDLGFPVSMYTARRTGLAVSRTRSMRPTTSPFELRKIWHGNSTTVGYQTNTGSEVGYIDNAGPASQQNAQNSSPVRYSNTMYWNGNSSSFGSAYYLYYSSQDWIHYNEDENSSTFTQSANIYVINYKALIDAINNFAANICDYSRTQALAYMRAIDTATSVNPQSYINGSNLSTEVTSCANAISSAISGIGTSKRNLTTTVNYASYVTLANNYSAYTPVAAGNNADGYYTSASYKTFKNAYDSVTNLFTSIGNGTLLSDATNFVTSLNNGYTGLVTAEKYIDDSELQALFAEYYNLTVSYYTPETYAAATSAVNEALQYYNNQSYTSGITLKDNEEDAAIYADILAKVQTGLKGLRVSHDASIYIGGTSFSYNIIVNYVNAMDSGKYVNFTELMDAVAQATVLVTELDKTDFTTEEEIISDYKAVLNTIATAFVNLQMAFTAIEDGTIISTQTGSTGGYSADNVATYLSNAIVHRTYFKTVSGQSSYTTEYDLSFNNTYYNWGANRPVHYHSLGFGAYGQDTVSYDNGTMSVRWKEGGAALNNADGSYTYHQALMKTPDTQTGENNSVMLSANTNNQRIMGETTVTAGDLGIRAVDFVTPDIYEHFWVYTGVGNETKSRTNTDVKQTITIIDISDLIEKTNEASAILSSCQNNAFSCYTPDSWQAFSAALTAAQSDMAYTDMTNEQIVAEAQTRYNNLQTAITNLKLNTVDGSHNLIEQADSTHATCTSDGTAHYTCSVCGYDVKTPENALGHGLAYTSDGNGSTHTVTCSRGDINTSEACTDGDGNLYCDLCNQALYDPANWDDFNTAKGQLEAALQSAADGTVKYTSGAYSALNTAIEAIGYYNYDASQQASVSIDYQEEINAQTAAVNAAYEQFISGIADDSVYEANIAKTQTLNADAYDVAAVQSAVDGIGVESTVAVNGKDYTAYDYDNYNMALGTALTENWIPYTIVMLDQNEDEYWVVDDGDGTFSYVSSESEATEFHYGDTITLESPYGEDEVCRWATYVYTDNIDSGAANKYQATDVTYTFNVRGYTEVYTTAGADSDDSLYRVRFWQALDGVKTGKLLDVYYSSKTFRVNLLDIQHNIPFYQLDGFYSDDMETLYGTGERAQIPVSKDMDVVVNYTTISPTAYTIKLVDESGSELQTVYAEYNELVTLSAPDAAAYINDANGKALCYGSEYEFYACCDITVKAVKEIAQQTASVDLADPIADGSGKVYFVGSFALPEGAEIKSYGFVLDGYNTNHTDLSLADIDSTQAVYNLSASNYTCKGQNGNQFTVSFNSNRSYPRCSLVAYAIYETADGNEFYAYSDVKTSAVIY